ncbi:MAG: HemK family protein methyltransferase [bacterium]
MQFLNCQIDLSRWNFRPRAETESWVKKALKKISFQKEAKLLNMLDIFAGSGCIGIAVLKNIKNSFCDFADIDERAVGQIKINLKLNKISQNRYKIYQSDLFKKIKNKKYDYIFANPPYVATERINEVQPSVLKSEPKKALFAGRKGLIVIKKFLTEAKNHLKKNSVIYMEFDALQKRDIENLLKKEGYKNYCFFKDQFGKYRWLMVYLNK